jgi:hypothetical protein
MEGQFLFVRGQKFGVSSGVGQIHIGDYGHTYGQTALEGEKVAPICNGATFDLESTEG